MSRKLVTESLPPLLEFILAGREPAASRAFAELRLVWRPVLGRLKRKLGFGISDFDQRMDLVLLKACRRCDPKNLVFKWWFAVIRNGAVDMFREERDRREHEILTRGGSLVPSQNHRSEFRNGYSDNHNPFELEDERERTEARYEDGMREEALRVAVSRLPAPERIRMMSRLGGNEARKPELDDPALEILRSAMEGWKP